MIYHVEIVKSEEDNRLALKVVRLQGDQQRVLAVRTGIAGLPQALQTAQNVLGALGELRRINMVIEDST